MLKIIELWQTYCYHSEPKHRNMWWRCNLWLQTYFPRSCCLYLFCKISFLKNLSIFEGKHLREIRYYSKFLPRNGLHYGRFQANCRKCFQTAFLPNSSGRLLFNKISCSLVILFTGTSGKLQLNRIAHLRFYYFQGSLRSQVF